jgi:hypothetical protein
MKKQFKTLPCDKCTSRHECKQPCEDWREWFRACVARSAEEIRKRDGTVSC